MALNCDMTTFSLMSHSASLCRLPIDSFIHTIIIMIASTQSSNHFIYLSFYNGNLGTFT